jgi:hypothetical protein
MSFKRPLFWLLFTFAPLSAGLAAAAVPAQPPAVYGPARTIEAALPAAPSGPEVRVLFIGNSLTYTWAMPRMLTGLARAGGVNLASTEYAPGGARLVQQASNPEVKRLLAAGGWKTVVIQEQSQWPAFRDDQVRREVDPYARMLADAARSATPGVRIVFYGTFARRNGDQQNAASMPEVATYEGMQNRLTATYRRLARELGGTVAPVGETWRGVRRSRPDLELYGDETHQNKTGAYLIACVFYGTLFARSPEGLKYTAGLDESVARMLQRAAWNAVIAEASVR